MRLLNALAASAAVAALSVVVIPAATAATITSGFTYSVADAFGGASGVGTHFHSNTGGSFGNPAGLAEVGRLGGEEVRGLSEYNLAGLASAASAFVTFDVYQLGGLFGQSNYAGPIGIHSYTGNNTENLSDFEALSTTLIGTFDSTGLTESSVVSFDITSLFNTAIGNGDSSLGIRLQMSPLIDPNQAIVFHDFRLTTDNQSNGIPEPGTLGLAALALIGLVTERRRRQG
ncbi:PEP-CTERM sorting domain-containing protein [Zoogloea sp.]|uniref:PEP-CTERM sorting domain-containing protein n=1 Tax=Zoogloea sp. TaxID=49181 RepID=UPI00262685BA|nr:PEP-CTERM sorting domain-containing protein [Zoogloea sp.]MDD3354210.1 PEP-CTERM sorting domain-containing protein [Zoogloea sp.]